MAGGHAHTLEAIERLARPTANQWRLVAVCAIAAALEFLDGYLIAFVLTFITGPWKLEYGQTVMPGAVGAETATFRESA